ncbi:hypothetical protein UlMin_028150 [Ulmus minor]
MPYPHNLETTKEVEAIMMEMLWGESNLNTATKKWTSKNFGSTTCKHGFMQFYYEPIKQIINTCMNNQTNKLWPLLQKLGVTMKSEEKDLMGKPLMKRVMQTWPPTSTYLLEMMIFCLPSPGLLGDKYATSIRNCDLECPIMLYVPKMIPASDKGRFFSFGHVFSSKVSIGLKVRIILYVKSVQRTVIWMGKKQETVEDFPCGNTVALVASDLPKLVESLKCLAKSGPMVMCTIEESGEHIKDMQDDLMGGAKIIKYDPTSCRTVKSKSPNMHNRLYMEAQSLEEGLYLANKIWCLGSKTTGPNMFVDTCKRVQYLNEFKDSVAASFQWSSKEGVLVEEYMRGICYEVCDIIIAKPRLLKPVYLGEIQTLEQAHGGFYSRPCTLLYNIKAYPLVIESFRFCSTLRDATSGKSSEPLEVGSKAATLVIEIKKWKGLK